MRYTAVLLLLLSSPVLAATLQPGDILVADQYPFGVPGAILRVDPVSGAQNVIASGPPFVRPVALSLAPSGWIYVMDNNDNSPAGGTLYRVDPATGVATIVASGSSLLDAGPLALDANGDLLTAPNGTGAHAASLIRIDPADGSTTVISSGWPLWGPCDLAIDSAGDVVAADVSFGGRIIRIDRTTGTQSVLSYGSATIYNFRGVAIDEDGSLVVTGESAAGGAVARIDPLTGAQTLITEGGFLVYPFNIRFEADGHLITADELFPGKIVRIKPATGMQSIVSTGGNISWPVGICIVPGLPVREVAIDVRPAAINFNARGVVPVAIFSDDGFDATGADQATLLLNGAPPVRCGANHRDFLCEFRTERIAPSTTLVLEGKTHAGARFRGSDSVRMVP